MRRRRGRGMERWMDGRERDVFYITIAFLEDSFCRGKRRSENGEREKEERRKREEKRKEKQESEKRLVRMRTAKHFLRASAWLHVRERPDAFDFSAETFFLVFFFSSFLFFFHFCFVFSFLLQERRKRRRRYRRRKPIPSTLRRQEQHRYIILEHSSRVRINHHHQHERYLSVPSSKYYKKVSLQKSIKP